MNTTALTPATRNCYDAMSPESLDKIRELLPNEDFTKSNHDRMLEQNWQVVVSGLSEVEPESLIGDPMGSYNQRIWDDKVRTMIGYGAKFYTKDGDLWVIYKADGINFASEFHPFHSALTSNGFVQIHLTGDTLYRRGYGDRNLHSLENCARNRVYMRRTGSIFSNSL